MTRAHAHDICVSYVLQQRRDDSCSPVAEFKLLIDETKSL